MPRAPPPSMVVLGAIALFLVYVIYTADHSRDSLPATRLRSVPKSFLNSHDALSDVSVASSEADTPPLPPFTTQHGYDNPTAGKLSNESLKAELGRAAWLLFHTTMARFPDHPTEEETLSLKQYIHLFARLYPCGECAAHFQEILKRYPPQTSSRNVAAGWACFVHNEVNISKGKEVFDCAAIGDFYDCGCAEDGAEEEEEERGEEGKKMKTKSITHEEPFEITEEGPTNGG